MVRNKRKAQSILEYTLVVGAVIAVFIFVLFGSGTGSVKNRIHRVYSKTSDGLAKTEANTGDKGVFNGAVAADLP